MKSKIERKIKIKMKLNYDILRWYAESQASIGKLDGFPVRACSSKDAPTIDEKCYYVVYDDNNKLIKKNKDGRIVIHGTVDEDGNFDDSNTGFYYVGIMDESYDKTAAAEDAYAIGMPGDYMPTENYAERLNVDKVLKSARETTIEDLLKGFDYGLD